MKFLVVDTDVKHQYLAKQLQDEGHEVLLLTPGDYRTEDLVPRTHNPQEAETWNPDIAFFNRPGAGHYANLLQKNGTKVVGGSLLHDNIHNDPEYAAILASRVRVPVFPMDVRFGIKLNLAGFFSGKSFINPAFSYFQDFGLLDKGGPPEGMAIHALPSECPLVQETFGKLEPLFCAHNFIGPVFLQMHIDFETKVPHIHAITLTPPDGFWPAFIAGLDVPFGRFLQGLASNKRFDVKFTEEVSGAVKVSLPPYPVFDCEWLEGDERLAARELLARGARDVHIDAPAETSDIFWMNVRRNGTGDTYLTTGPEVAFVGGVGDWSGLTYVLKNRADRLNIPRSQYTFQLIGRGLSESLAYFADFGALEVGDMKFREEYGERLRAGRYRKQDEPAKEKPDPKPKKTTKKKAKAKK